MILFITRKFPPSKGGMERVAYELSQRLSRVANVKLVKWGGSNKWLPLILPYFFLKSLWVLISSRIRVIYLEDGLLAPLGLTLKILTRKPVVITIHGRDIAYENWLYQLLVPRCINRLDRVICVSRAIKEACLKRGVDGEKTAVVANGISDEFYMDSDKRALKAKLAQVLGRNLGERKILLSVGRLVEKKGIHWFVAKVMPQLAETGCAYVIAGDGILAPLIRRAIEENQLENSVFMLGWANADMLRILYNAADIFIMPNVPVVGDMEGFGLVALETSSCGLPVVASNLEGIKDAIEDGKNGLLIQPNSVQGFASAVRQLLENDELREGFGAQARKFTLENYGWETMTQRYLEEFAKLGG